MTYDSGANNMSEDHWSAGAGTIIGGRYVVVRPLGRGAFGEVYEVIDPACSNLKAALKVFPRLSVTDELRASISREVLALSCVEHPNVVRFFNVVNDDLHPSQAKPVVLRASFNQS